MKPLTATTIALISTKGGVGKTTLAGHLAVEAERRGAGPVGLADMDPQGSLSEWWNARKAPTPLFMQTSLAHARRDFAKLKLMGVRLIIIDTPPMPSEPIAAALDLADLIVMPLRPSPHDIRSVRTTLALVAEHGKPVVFVLNMAMVRTRIAREAISLLSQYGPLAPTIVHQRVDYAVSMIDGRTVMEIHRTSAAGKEIASLWRYLEGWCSCSDHDHIPLSPAFDNRFSARA